MLCVGACVSIVSQEKLPNLTIRAQDDELIARVKNFCATFTKEEFVRCVRFARFFKDTGFFTQSYFSGSEIMDFLRCRSL